MEIAIALIIVVISAASIFRLNSIAGQINIRVSSNDYFNAHAKYQVALFILGLITLVLVYIQNPQNLLIFLSVGNIAAPVGPVPWFGISINKTWIFAGVYLSFIITLGTLSFVCFQFRKLGASFGKVFPYVGWIVLFSLSNSFSEEAIFRLGIISPLTGVLDPDYLMLISAAIFGLVHFGGMPNGFVGVFMAGFLGWFLAKSVIETEGIFWAWFIHFLQDIVIYLSFALNSIANNRVFQRESG